MRNAFRSKPCLADRTEFLVKARRRQSFKISHVRHLQRAQAVYLVRETPYLLKNLALCLETDRGQNLLVAGD